MISDAAKLSTSITRHRPLRTLIPAFLTVLVLALSLSGLGIWGVAQAQQRLEIITDSSIPRLQAISDARVALLTLQRDNRQVLLETTSYDHVAVLLGLDGDLADVIASLNHVQAEYGNAATALSQQFPVWYNLQERYLGDITKDTPPAIADALALQRGQLRSEEVQVATQLGTLASHEDDVVAVTRYHASQLRASLIVVLSIVGGISFVLLAGIGFGVTRTINQQHQSMARDHADLSELMEEVQMQNEEMDSQRASLAEALEESEFARHEFDIIFNTVQEGLSLFDAQGKELRRNAACNAILGDFPFAENIERQAPPYRLLTLDGKMLLPEHYPTRRALCGEVVATERYIILHDEGTRIIAQFEATPIINAQGRLDGVLRLVRDVSVEHRATRHAELLRMLAHTCAAALDEQAVAAAATTTLMEGMGMQNCSILLRDPARPGYARVLHMQLDASVSPEESSIIRENMSRYVICEDAPLLSLQVLATGQAHFNATPLPQPRPGDAGAITFAHRMLAYVPLRLDGDTFGVLATGYAPEHLAEWETPDEEFLVAVADEMATALHRAHLYTEAQQLAYTDPLTGLRNHRAMQQALHATLEAAGPLDQPVSVIMLDVDHFRRFNEAHGHDVGDRALQCVAHAIQSAVRNDDIAARYGGEEFCVILPDTDETEAVMIAERVRAAIAAARVPAREIPAGLPVTASLGCATSPQHATQPAALLKAADIALYAAKHGGRNQVVTFHATLVGGEDELQAA